MWDDTNVGMLLQQLLQKIMGFKSETQTQQSSQVWTVCAPDAQNFAQISSVREWLIPQPSYSRTTFRGRQWDSGPDTFLQVTNIQGRS